MDDQQLELGNLWAQALKGRERLMVGTAGSVGLSPTLILFLAKLAMDIIPILMDKCSEDGMRNAKPTVANRLIVRQVIIQQMGYIKFYWYGGRRLVDSAIRANAHPHIPTIMATITRDN